MRGGKIAETGDRLPGSGHGHPQNNLNVILGIIAIAQGW